MDNDLLKINSDKKDCRKSLKNDLNLSYKNAYLNELNNSIPEVSESISNSIEGKSKKNSKLKCGKQNVVQNNKYYINLIRNVYENENHLNRNSLIKKKSSYLNSSFTNHLDSNKKFVNNSKRRNSAINKDIFGLNFDKNIIMEKLNMNRNVSSTNVHKLKNDEINNLLHKKNLNAQEKEIVKTYFNKSKIKSHKKGKDKNKNKGSGKKRKKSNENLNNIKKVKEKDKDKDNDIENSTKAETISNSVKKKFKKFLCCLINNENTPIDNE